MMMTKLNTKHIEEALTLNEKSADLLKQTLKNNNVFLPRTPADALVEVKEILYDRLAVLRQCIGSDGPFDRTERQIQNEILFLTDLLNVIERS
jgi:hypothetical protein